MLWEIMEALSLRLNLKQRFNFRGPHDEYKRKICSNIIHSNNGIGQFI